MAKVRVRDITVPNYKSPFCKTFEFDVTFECIQELEEDLEWKVIYVASAEREAPDQVLNSFFVGPIPKGRFMFLLEAYPPDPLTIPVQDAVGVAFVFVTCSYRSKEFVRYRYYVINEYVEKKMKENPPTDPQFDKLQRIVLCTCPIITKSKINWDDNPGVYGLPRPPSSPEEQRENADNSNATLRQIFQESNHSTDIDAM